MITATSNYLAALAVYTDGPLFFAVEISTYSRVFTNQNDGISGHNPWIIQMDDFDYSVNELDGGADVASFGFTVADIANTITGDFPGFVFEGKQIVVKQGFQGLAYSDYVTLFTGQVDTVTSEANNTAYKFNCSDMSVKLSQVIFQSGDDGFDTSGDHKRTVQGHPLDILLNVLLVQLAIDPAFVDSTKIAAYRDGPFTGMKYVFNLDQAPAAGDFLKHQILKPMGGYLWVTSAGKITVNFFYPIALIAALDTFGPAAWTSIPTAEQVDLINQIQFQFDKNDAKGATGNAQYLSNDTEEFNASIAKYGLFGEQVINADGLRSAFQGFFIAAFVSRLLFLRNGNKNLKFEGSAADSQWKKVLYEPGDVVAVTHPQIPNRQTGIMGLTNKLFEIVNKRINFTEGLANYTMLDAGYLTANFGQFLITPDAEADYAAASGTDKAKYMFMTDNSGHYSNGDVGHGLG